MYNNTCNMHGHTEHFGASPLDSDYNLTRLPRILGECGHFPLRPGRSCVGGKTQRDPKNFPSQSSHGV